MTDSRNDGHVSRRTVLGIAVVATPLGLRGLDVRLTAPVSAQEAGAASAAGHVPAPETSLSVSPPAAGDVRGLVETRAGPAWPDGSETGETLLGESGLPDFSMIAVTPPPGSAGSSGQLELRFRGAGAGGWSPWSEVHVHDGARSSDPHWTGSASDYQLRSPAGSESVRGVLVHLARDPRAAADPAAPPAGDLIVASEPVPPIQTRSSWTSRPPRNVGYCDTIRIGTFHHTVNTNTYGPGDVPSILRQIQSLHMDVEGWDDIAYQFLVDRFGTLWEGRGGGYDESFIAAHTKGFNQNSFGLACIGTFSTGTPPAAMLSSAAELFAWKLKRYDVPADGLTTITATGVGNDWYQAGAVVPVPVIVGHRQLFPTECPGSALFPYLPSIRADARQRQWRYRVKPPPAVASTGPLARNHDGRLELFGIAADGTLRNIWQRGAVGTGWSDLGTLGGPYQPVPVSAIANLDGRLEVFLVGLDGTMQHTWQDPGSPSAWSGSYPLGIGEGTGAPPAVARNADGRLEIVAVNAAGQLWRCSQAAPNTGWIAPVVVSSGFAGTPAFGANVDGRLALTAVAADGTLHLWRQSTANGIWSWVGPIGDGVAGRPVFGRNPDGRLELFVFTTDGRLLHSWEANGTFGPLYPLGAQPFVHGPAVGRNADGRLEVFAVAADGTMWHAYQPEINFGWSDLSPVSATRFAGPPSVITNADGRLEVFARNPDGVVLHHWQVAPNSSWSASYPLAGGLIA